MRREILVAGMTLNLTGPVFAQDVLSQFDIRNDQTLIYQLPGHLYPDLGKNGLAPGLIDGIRVVPYSYPDLLRRPKAPAHLVCQARLPQAAAQPSEFRFCNSVESDVTFTLSIAQSTISLTIPPGGDVKINAAGVTTAAGSFENAATAYSLEAGTSYMLEQQNGVYVFAVQ